MESKEEKVRIKLTKVPLESEKREIRSRRRRTFLICIACFLLLMVGGLTGFAISGMVRGTSVAMFKTNKFDKILSHFKSVWLYKNDYEDLETTMEDKAFYGMTRFEDDPYSTYMSKSELEEFASGINMNYVGIGAQYTYTNDVATITRVFKESPAEKGGLLPGDIIFTINGDTLEGLDSEGIKERIIGEEGTPVNITVKRGGEEVELTFIRGAIEYTVYCEANDEDDYVYLDIMSFGKSTADECIKYLDEYKDYSKLIINLRDNSGGYQDSVQEVAGLFLGKNVVVLNETDNNGITKSYETIVKEYYDNFKKIVVITNEGTASAAEVLAIALKEEHPDCTLVGTTTYGKGVVQSSFYLEDGSALKITSSYWTSPNGTSIHKEGVKPDIEVYLDDILYQTAYVMNESDAYALDSVSTYTQIAQEGLKFLDYDVHRTDGYFDQSFLDALKTYKNDNDLNDNDKLDFDTYNSILSSIIREYNTNKVKDAQLQKAIEVIEG